MTPLGPNTAFVLTILGLFGIYAELVWPGVRIARVIGPGVAGLAGTIAGAYSLWLRSPSSLGLELLGAAVALFALDAAWNTYFVAGIGGTGALAVGFWRLFDHPPVILPGFVFPLCLVFGAVTTFLSYAAKTARRNKRVDIS